MSERDWSVGGADCCLNAPLALIGCLLAGRWIVVSVYSLGDFEVFACCCMAVELAGNVFPFAACLPSQALFDVCVDGFADDYRTKGIIRMGWIIQLIFRHCPRIEL